MIINSSPSTSSIAPTIAPVFSPTSSVMVPMPPLISVATTGVTLDALSMSGVVDWLWSLASSAVAS